MRKTWKRALSLVLSAALVVTAGAFGSVQDKKAQAADKLFTAHLASFGTIWGWTGDDFGKPATPGAWSVDVTGTGTYTVKGEATSDCDSSSGVLAVVTDLTALPTGYTIVPKTVKINDKEHDWSKAEPYVDGKNVRMSIWNEWGKDENGKLDPKANPLGEVEIKSGDKVEATFAVVKAGVLFTAHLASFGSIWGWTGDDLGKPATPGAWSVEVTGDGDYTVKGEATSDCDSTSGVLAVVTDLTALPTTFDITPKTVKINSKEYDWSKATPYVDGKNVRMSIWNEWGKDENGKLDPKANPLGDVEIKSGDTVEATFSVKKKATVKPTVKPPVTNVTTKVDGLAKGKTFSAGSLKYKITKAATITSDKKKKTNGTVQVVGFSKSGKKKSSINVKNTVSRKGVKYNVKSIKSKAFQKSKKLKKATLGSKITSIPTSAFNADKKLTTVKATGVKKIGKSAFKGCKALKKLTLGKKKLTSVKKGAFKGCKKKIKVSGGSKKVKKANVKKLKKSGYKKFK